MTRAKAPRIEKPVEFWRIEPPGELSTERGEFIETEIVWVDHNGERSMFVVAVQTPYDDPKAKRIAAVMAMAVRDALKNAQVRP